MTKVGFYLESEYLVSDPNPGVGNAGFGFVFDASQADTANIILAAFPDLRIGLAATAINAQGGPETFSFRVVDNGVPGGEIPEPGTYALAASALFGLAVLRKYRQS